MNGPEVDVTQFLQVVEEALRLAYATIVGVAFLAALYAMGSLLVLLWEGRDD